MSANTRFSLRTLEEKDAPLMLEWMHDPSINRFFRFDAEKMTEEKCREYIRSAAVSADCRHYAVVDDNDEYLGTISLKGIDAQKGTAEYAISMRSCAHGSGAAMYATKELLRKAFDELGLNRVYLNVLSDNVRANRFYEKAGFKFVREEKEAVEIRGEKHSLKWYEFENDKAAIDVSVAVITYNMARYLPKLLDSIFMQKVNFRLEVVVDDDCSPDNTREILYEYKRRYPNELVLSLRDSNVGGSKNMYNVLRMCRGRYIAIIEGDDWWESDDKLQYQYDFLETHPEYVAMYCNSMCETNRSDISSFPRRKTDYPRVYTLKDFRQPHFLDRLPSSTETVMLRNVFANGSERELDVFWRAHNMVWDQSLALILYGKGDVYYDPRIMTHHRTVVEAGGTNYQSLYAARDNSVSDAAMYACHEEYIENVLHKRCGRFYKARGDLFAQNYWKYRKSKNPEDKARYAAIWKQRKRKLPLVWWTFVWGCGSLKRKIKGVFRRA